MFARKLTRDFYVPTGSQLTDVGHANVAVYRLDNPGTNILTAVCFVGKSIKPCWYHRAITVDQFNEKIQATVALQQRKDKRKQDAAIQRKNMKAEALKTIKVGDIYVETFSFESTSISFLQVTEIKGSRITLEYIGKTYVETDETYSRNLFYVADPAIKTGKFITRTPTYMNMKDKHISLSTGNDSMYHSIFNWDNEPTYQTNSQFA